ncbi:MAG: hypothetical protein AABX82_05350, partial [Nanoarchaeota archaeon]
DVGNFTLGENVSNLTEPITFFNPGLNTVDVFTDAQIIDLFTDTNGFSIGAQQEITKKYKIFIPEGVPLNASLYASAVEKRSWDDEQGITQWKRSNINDLWPRPSDAGDGIFTGAIYSSNLSSTTLTASPNASLFADDFFWGHQSFAYNVCTGDDCIRRGPPVRDSFLRKHIWISKNVVKSEQIQTASQICSDFLFEEPSGITTWINGVLKSSFTTECNQITKGHTPNLNLLVRGTDNEFDVFQFGPHRTFDVILYEVVGFDVVDSAIEQPVRDAFILENAEIGNEGLLRRQYEESVNLTITNNDDDALKVDVVSVDLISPTGKLIHLMTDTIPRSVAPESSSELEYKVIIPGDVPLSSKMRVQV